MLFQGPAGLLGKTGQECLCHFFWAAEYYGIFSEVTKISEFSGVQLNSHVVFWLKKIIFLSCFELSRIFSVEKRTCHILGSEL